MALERILVSACLLGRPVRYDGAAKPVHDALMERWRAEGRLVSFCPEVSGGLSTPRPPAEIDGDAATILDAAAVLDGTAVLGGTAVLEGTARVRTDTGEDVTEQFVRGARLALEAAERAGARMAVLKEGSPSCAKHRLYDGTFSGTR
ncbi:DUF523 domain-containing protein, partial [Actinomadura sp. 9N407]|uniref:DUF523 domain-containing protein n=1 Tax=Actinomadura sp. 9N407 TaxID=3375154 RepID=UPI00378E5A69